MKIYVSPSDQTANLYATGDTNEAEQCRKVAKALVAALERCGFEAKTNYDDGSDAMDNRIAESNAWGADAHIPIHTNAYNGQVQGTRLFCYAFNTPGHELCKAVMETLSPITPGESDGIKEAPSLAEVKRVSAITCYVEMVFHDNPEEAAWMINNTAAAAEAICQGVCNYYGVTYVAPDAKTDGLYNTLEDCPAYAQATVEKLLEKGYLAGTTSGLELSGEMLRLLVINDRAGIYD